MEKTRRPSRGSGTKRAPRDDRTKFDKWLERLRDERTAVELNFSVPPKDRKSNLEVVSLQQTCQIIDVDRYMLLLEFPDGEVWWVSKGNILSAAPEDSPIE